MSWLERISVRECTEESTVPKTDEQEMSPGITGQYDWQVREKAGMHNPPPPPEYMGVEGEFDQSGLAKRVALALDREPTVEDMKTLEIIQTGKAISLKGQVTNQAVLDRIVKIIEAVDGTDQVDTHEVEISEGK